MKKNIVQLFLLCATAFGAYGENITTGVKGVTAEVQTYEYRNDSVYVALDFELDDIELSSNESVIITPTLFRSAAQRLELPTLVLRGRSSAKSYKRTVALSDEKKLAEYNAIYKTPYEVINLYGNQLDEIEKQDGIYHYTYAAPYQTWMVESQIILACESYGCCEADDEGELALANSALAVDLIAVDSYDVLPHVSLIKPEKVAVKRRDIQYSASLIFRVNSSVIDPALANNQAELNSIDSMMQSVVSDPDYTITAVKIAGYASPEGTLATNQRLSERRALALENILKKKYNIAPNLYHVAFGGENWDALIPMVEASDFALKEEILNIIQNVAITDGRETKLMQLAGGVPYRYMLRNFFPAVRLVEVHVEFNVDAYDLVRIKEVITEKPENLSLEEMYRLSETYDVDSDEFLNVFLTAVEVYPNDQVALNNAIVTDLQKGDVVACKKLVSRLDENTQSAVTLNTLGAYHLMAGNYEKSGELLRKAATLGSTNAPYNLEQLQLKLKNVEELRKSEELRRKIYGN